MIYPWSCSTVGSAPLAAGASPWRREFQADALPHWATDFPYFSISNLVLVFSMESRMFIILNLQLFLALLG